ncbi:uncharacterized protein LOC103508104 isoform X1 [Diaphorina citri]|uniref:Uncharacterized protein LOC103508104 isoform X1 n=2 Tax=Diaphorina citri TaxID=121845 RepID=A0A1S3CZ89_DIACI|nr:uncharacterized protein LOC103508104 isoform X1 [Diaphorina citri]
MVACDCSAVLVLLTVFGKLSTVHCYDLFAGLDDDDSVRNKINSQDIRTEAPEMPIHEDYYTEATLVPSRKYRGRHSNEKMLDDMKNKKLFQKVEEDPNLLRMLDGLSYDEDEDEVTMYHVLFSHETSTTPKPVGRSQNLIKGRRDQSTSVAPNAEIVQTIPESQHGYEDITKSLESSESEPKQITSQEPLYEYYMDVIKGNQTVLRRKITTIPMNTVGMDKDHIAPLKINGTFNNTLAPIRRNRTRKRRIQTTTEYKILRTEKSNKYHKLEKKYAHLVIGKLPNTTKEKETDCLEKEILHIFTVENMKSYVSELVHYYKHYRSHFNDVVNLVSNISIFSIETDSSEYYKHKKLNNSKITLKHGQFETTHGNEPCKQPIPYVPTTVKTHLNAEQEGLRKLNEKFDLTALDNLFKEEKIVRTGEDKLKCEKIHYNLIKILHCLKLNLNLEKYNYINETNIDELMHIIWKNRIKYDDSDYESEYEDVYYMAKTMDYYEVSEQYKQHYEYYLNKDSGIEDEGTIERNPETQNVIKEALRNITRLRKERHEFDRGILEGQVKNRCHYCGKNYSESKEYRYMKHVHNHIVEELEGPNFQDGANVQENECWVKAFSYMTKATKPTLPTVDIFPYYENLMAFNENQNFGNPNMSTRGLEELAALKRREDAKKRRLQKNIDAKAKREERERDFRDMKNYLNKNEFVTFSDESLPAVMKRFIRNYANDSQFNMDDLDKILKDRDTLYTTLEPFTIPELKTDKGPEENILGKFKEHKEKQDEYRIRELKKAAKELLKHKDWRTRLNVREPEVDVKEREAHIQAMRKIHRKRYQQKLLREKKQREMQQLWHEDNLNADKWVFKTNVWTTLASK